MIENSIYWKCNSGTIHGTVLDPFFGSGTIGVVAERFNRKWIGIDLNKDYCEIAKNRILDERQKEFHEDETDNWNLLK